MSSQNPKSPLLKEDGSNMYDVSLPIADWRGRRQSEIEARRIWPVQGGEKAMRKFNLWNRFPHDIRRCIFEYACYEPRVVEIICTDSNVTSPTPTPPVLHACATSRNAGLKVYERLEVSGNMTDIYINWQIDTIYIKNGKDDTWPGALDSELSSKGAKLAVDFGIYPVIPSIEPFKNAVPIINLQTVIMISGLDISTIKKRVARANRRRRPTPLPASALIGAIEVDDELDELMKDLTEVTLSEAAENQDEGTMQTSNGTITFIPALFGDEIEMALLRRYHHVEQEQWEEEHGIEFDFKSISRGPVQSADESTKRRQRKTREAENERANDPVQQDIMTAQIMQWEYDTRRRNE